MNHSLLHLVWVISVMVLSACSTIETSQEAKAQAEDQTRIELTQPLHFAGLDGSDVVVPAGSYRVEQATGSGLRLISAGGSQPIMLRATAGLSEYDLPAPAAVLIPNESDSLDILLMLPNRSLFTAKGSANAIQLRGLFP